MEKSNEKKGLFARLNGIKKPKKSSCCCNFEVEEVPEEGKEDKNKKESPKGKDDSCC